MRIGAIDTVVETGIDGIGALRNPVVDALV
jgi:hypothetical protein